MVALAHAEIAGPGIEVWIEALISEPHLRVQKSSPRHRSATGRGCIPASCPCRPARSCRKGQPPHTSQPDRLLDMRRGGLVGIDPRQDLDLVRPRMPDAKGARTNAQPGEIGNRVPTNGLTRPIRGPKRLRRPIRPFSASTAEICRHETPLCYSLALFAISRRLLRPTIWRRRSGSAREKS